MSVEVVSQTRTMTMAESVRQALSGQFTIPGQAPHYSVWSLAGGVYRSGKSVERIDLIGLAKRVFKPGWLPGVEMTLETTGSDNQFSDLMISRGIGQVSLGIQDDQEGGLLLSSDLDTTRLDLSRPRDISHARKMIAKTAEAFFEDSGRVRI